MLSQSDIIDKIQAGKIRRLNQSVRVQYEPSLNSPIDFWINNIHYEVLEVIFTRRINSFSSEFLVRSNKGVYNLRFYSFEIRVPKINIVFDGWWKLDFQVLEV